MVYNLSNGYKSQFFIIFSDLPGKDGLSKAIISALVSLCKSNERQLVFATMNYADDYQDILPTYNKLTA